MSHLPHGGDSRDLWEGRSSLERLTRYEKVNTFNVDKNKWEAQIHDTWMDRVVGFTCKHCYVVTASRSKPYVSRCKPCNRKMYGWRQQKAVFEQISERISNWKELTLITLTTRNVIVGPDNHHHEVEGLRKSLMAMMRKLTRSKRDRNKLERSWWRNHIKGWMHTFEVVVTPVTMTVPAPWWQDEGDTLSKTIGYRLNAHIHCLAERQGGPIDHKQLKKQAQVAGFGPVANIKWVKPKTRSKNGNAYWSPDQWVKAGKATCRYVLKYILKARSEFSNVRYYERGGSWRGRVS